mgnify:CR=1 FL=1|tara:strand:+ start:5465 stop:8401 length:2937 start_codon:yes stop_codon:yes gene_type:complete
MSVKNFKFVSPGVFINEIDNSFLPQGSDAIGPVVIGRAQRGLAMQPVTVESYSKFVEMFGDTVPGNGGGDIWRRGNYQSPMYGTYAAKAFLRANVAPLTYMRLLGQQSANNDGSTDAMAGWQTSGVPLSGSTTVGGAYGLFVAPSSSTGQFTGTTAGFQLAAVVYLQSGSLQLSGTVAGSTATVMAQGSSTIIESDSSGNFTVVINGNENGQKKYTINFNDSSELFIRKRLNTNPQLTSTAGAFYPAASYEDYWLGSTFEQELRERSLVGGGTTTLCGIVAGLASGSAEAIGPHKMKGQPSQEAIAGWFIGQDLGTYSNYQPANATKLFRLIGRGHGEWMNKNIKVSIQDIRQSNTTTSDYGTFSIVLRQLSDTDSNVVVMERFDLCSLDPSSPNYVGRKIGDKYDTWDATTRTLKTYGDFDNQSRFVRIEMNADVEAGATDPVLLPFGYYGPPKLRDISENIPCSSSAADASQLSERFVVLGTTLPGYVPRAGGLKPLISSSFTSVIPSASFYFPSVRLRSQATDGGLSDPTNAYFGFEVTRTATSTRADASAAAPQRLWYIDLGQTSNVPVDVTTSTYNLSASSAIQGFSYIFTMDNVSASSTSVYTYASGSRRSGLSTSGRGTNTYTTLLDAGYNRFTAPFWGGFDGVDLTVPDPFYNLGMGAAATEDNSYAYYTYKRAIDTIADPEYINMNLLAAPGLTTDALTTHMINVCAERADSLALVDLTSVYIPSSEKYYASKASRIGTTPTAAAAALKDRRLDSSYGATFYPWLQTRDEQSGRLLWVPPSVAMMGVLASSERRTAVWFAPAGFNRGGLTDGAAGIPITNVTERLTSKNRDTLYEARINPIASFPSSGIVVFGQKTLQERPSALDRINVRRLVIYLKKQISIMSTQVLFEQNVQATWNRFTGLIEPFLANVKTQFGITDYKLILDETTTTPDLIDQNVLYAKIMIKPARAIEYIAIDFVIMSTGASFDD